MLRELITQRPYLIEPDTEGSRLVYGDGSIKHESLSPYAYISQQCLLKGCTAEGRMDAFRFLTHITQKPSIMIDDTRHEVYFPTLSYMNPDCIYLLYNVIADIKKIDEDHTEILFMNGFKALVPHNIRSIRLQLKRCKEFLEIIDRQMC